MTKIAEIQDPVKRLFEFARERHAIYVRRKAGKKPPWTKDEILCNYRFTNVYRENDRVTRWIADHWRRPHRDDPELWFAMCVARLLNQPECLQDLGYPVPWSRLDFLRKLRAREQAGNRIFNAAYIVSTNGTSTNKVVYLADYVLDPLWQRRAALRPTDKDTLNSFHMLLGQMHGFGSFMSAQIVADMKYVEPLCRASDWQTFAASGPGSRRGLNYVLGKERKAPWQEDEWRLEAGRLREKLLPMFKRDKMPLPHAQDVQNLLCEYSKYHRAVTEGKMPKQIYRWNHAN